LLTPAQADDMFAFRALIEPWAASQAATRHTASDAEAIRAELDVAKQVKAVDFDEAYALLGYHDERFHDLIAQASGSKYLRDTLSRMHCHMHMFRLYQSRKNLAVEQQDNPGSGETVFKQFYNAETGFLTVSGHAQIAEAIFAHDAEKAQALMLEHIEGSRIRNSTAIELMGGA